MYKLVIIVFILLEVVNLSEVSYYEILGVSKDSSTQEIRQAYKKLAIKFHPDKNSNTAEQDKFIKITEAYETLKDPEKRQNYDHHGSYPSYTRRYDGRSQSEYNTMFYNGLYHNDPFVDTLTGQTYFGYLSEGFHFINFYSPFCPPCQNLVENWKKLAEIYKGIVKVGAVNCKYHNSFCYNSMGISSYPSLLFYPNGKQGNFIYYQGSRSLEALEQFLLAHLGSRVHVPVASRLRAERPTAYVLGNSRLERGTLTRIAFHLTGIVDVVMIVEDELREKLTKNDFATVVFKYNEIIKEIESTDEKELLREIVSTLPKIDHVGPEEFKDIRNRLRSSLKSPWVIYFSATKHDRLSLYQMRVAFPDMYFAEIDCDKWIELCASLQVDETPAWGIMKVGGAYQKAPPTADIKSFIQSASAAVNLHTLSASDFTRILEGGDVSMWVLAVVPYRLSWSHIAGPLTETSLQFLYTDEISFGVMACTLHTDKQCREIADQPVVIIQEGRNRHYYNGKIDSRHLAEFIQLIVDSHDMEMDEQQVLEVMNPQGRQHHWLVAYLPARCGRACDQLAHEWRRVWDKLRALEYVRVGMLRCAQGEGGLCANIRSPTARLYPLAASHHYTVNLQQLSEAPYIWEWALQHIDSSVVKFDWHSFMDTVAVEHIKPPSGIKPWLVYFHSPRCYHCYEMYADFAITGILLQKAVNVGKVNCVTDRELCQSERIASYPALRLYLARDHRDRLARGGVVALQPKRYEQLVQDVRAHLAPGPGPGPGPGPSPGLGPAAGAHVHAKHDEF